jgi:RNA polymerase sigma factor (TIGR02999 family)
MLATRERAARLMGGARPPARGQVTLLLDRMQEGDRHAADDLLPLVYDELRKLAGSRMARERPGQTLQATALVHEAYMRLVGKSDPGWDHRGHFFASAAEAMRRILVEAARRKSRVRHGGELRAVTLDRIEEFHAGPQGGADEVLAFDTALTELEAEDPALARVVELRAFVGMTVGEIAEATETPRRTVDRQWSQAKRWLRDRLQG